VRLKILVRARKDAKAVEAAARAYYPDFDVRVESLGGARGEELASRIASEAEPFTLAILPRGAASLVSPAELPPLARLVEAPARDVRNLRLAQIAALIDRGRALIRLAARWSPGLGSYILDAPAAPPGVEASPDSDNTLLYSRGLDTLSGLVGWGLSGHALAYTRGDSMVVHYSGEALAGLSVSPPGPRVEWARPPPGGAAPAPLEAVAEANRGVLEAAVGSLASWLRGAAGEPSRVIVPWSGGKDSTAALIVAVEAFGAERVVAVAVDTGVEFPESGEYIERASSRLGVEVVQVRAPLREAILGGRGLPRRGERWCTGLKLEALASAVRRIARGEPRPVVVVGDRDAESRARSRRPQARVDPYHGILTLAPLKLLGGAHALLIPVARGLGVNGLYGEGFYRIGCYICPYMRGWELHILRSRLRGRLESRLPEARRLLGLFLDGGN